MPRSMGQASFPRAKESINVLQRARPSSCILFSDIKILPAGRGSLLSVTSARGASFVSCVIHICEAELMLVVNTRKNSSSLFPFDIRASMKKLWSNIAARMTFPFFCRLSNHRVRQKIPHHNQFAKGAFNPCAVGWAHISISVITCPPVLSQWNVQSVLNWEHIHWGDAASQRMMHGAWQLANYGPIGVNQQQGFACAVPRVSPGSSPRIMSYTIH